MATTTEAAPLDIDGIMALRDNDRHFSYTDTETMLYALGAGMGRDPLDAKELPYVYEGGRGLIALPSIGVVLTRSSLPRTLPLNFGLVLHGEQFLKIHRTIPPAAELLADTRITRILDKGPGKGMVLYHETVARTAHDGQPLYTAGGSLFARGDGGRGGTGGTAPTLHQIPDRAPDIVHSTETRLDQALLYRLSGDRNPLHADPAVATKAGFPVPILHGLCTYAIAGCAILAAVCDYDAARIGGLDVRFTSPVLPGDTVETDIWIDGSVASFRCRVPGRNIIAINNGRCLLVG